MKYTTYWLAFAGVVIISFSVLGYYGYELYQKAPPLPKTVQTPSGDVLYTKKDIQEGQQVWQSFGGQQLGSIWGHGAYTAPDWSADWLHREAMWLLNHWSQARHNRPFAKLHAEQKAALRSRVQGELRKNTYSPRTKILLVSNDRARAIRSLERYYAKLFSSDKSLKKTREAYAMPDDVVPDASRRKKLAAFFFWASWSCVTQRPQQTISYTHNWPPEPLVGNKPTSSLFLWSILSVIFLLAGISAMVWYMAFYKKEEHEKHDVPSTDPFLETPLTASMKSSLMYFWVVIALILLQLCLGVLTAHYGVEGTAFYGIPLAKLFPYTVTRTWHIQLGIFWIATAWLATGLYIAPNVSGKEPVHQNKGVLLLFCCLLLIVAGSLFGTWYATRQKMGLTTNFWFGHQGYEYVELGRFWQIFLFIGLFLWLFLMVRALLPSLRKSTESKHLLLLFVLASAAIPLFYGAGLMWGQHTHLSIAEYWRWWVVHLWVEGFFEVFATVVIAFLFAKMGLLSIKTATKATLFATTIFLTGGILGTFHHLYFAGTTVPIMALGAMFSALEVVPLTLIGFEAHENYTLVEKASWVKKYKWPILFFVAVAFWNMVGAGLFGFLINPPLSLYYMQGLNTTPVHGHSALFGVYGMLGIGLMLFCFRTAYADRDWNERALFVSFWGLNIGLALMVLMSLLPVGLLQTWASVEHSMWYARSMEFLQTPTMQTLRWLRAIGDTIFGIGGLALVWFLYDLYKAKRTPPPQPSAEK
ncbi:MAG TPA: nitric oxide reductase large subunit [Myxococcales bacterium]|nr:nitric oxide reductase large subunit [Deltaproteobacteria bacterium]MBU50198.1 nitric oxide reductase large subunit [Deltaproteobacteria bacterium]HAA57705.1 nitric oxide reductase large subunit [Myxococcales bacterium]